MTEARNTNGMRDRAAEARGARRTGLVILGVCGLMLGLSFAAVPLYRLFCQMTGYGGTTQVAKAAPEVEGGRTLTVRFDGNVANGLPWSFAPEQGSVSVRTGRSVTVFYKVANNSDAPVTAMAAYNVAPDQAGVYFNKVSCFCFSEQTLGPRETAEWPVVFFLDPALEKDETMARVDGVTLSYTFFPVKRSETKSKS
jgi:cytochrome c oxidase assembly protein subunit 11